MSFVNIIVFARYYILSYFFAKYNKRFKVSISI